MGSPSLQLSGKNLNTKLSSSSTWSLVTPSHLISSSLSKAAWSHLSPQSSSFTNLNIWGGTVFRWVWGGKLIQSQGGAGEQMERNGDAQKKHTQTQSTVRDTCTEAETVQESLWKQQLVLLLIPVDQSTKIQPPLLTLTPPLSLPSHQWPLTPTLTTTTLAITLISTTISFIPIPLLQGLLGMIFLPKKSIPICSWTLVLAPILINITGMAME